jgi:hypothetical protein
MCQSDCITDVDVHAIQPTSRHHLSASAPRRVDERASRFVCLLRSIVPKPSTRSNQIPAVDARPSRRWHSHPYARPFRLKRAAHTPPGCCSPPPRSFSTRRDETRLVAKFSLCCVLPVSRSRPHCLVFTCSVSIFFLLPLSLLPFYL